MSFFRLTIEKLRRTTMDGAVLIKNDARKTFVLLEQGTVISKQAMKACISLLETAS